MKRQIYYIYAGYYELIITEQKIGRPYVYQAYAYSLEGAMARCEKIDSDAGIVYSHNLKDEVLAHFSWIDEEDLNVPFLDTEKYTLDNL